MKRKELYERRAALMIRHKYSLSFWKYYDYSVFRNIMYLCRKGQDHKDTYNDVIIMLDTETSKEKAGEVCENYIVAWTISIRAFNTNICTLYGQKPSECIECIGNLIMQMPGDKTVFYIHNLSYDWVFLRKFMMAKWGTPAHQLNVKSHYPIYIEFGNGIILKDSLILAQRKLEKWSQDMDAEHKKAVGLWDYDKVRMQDDFLNAAELTYIEHDTLSGVECIQKTMDALHKNICSMPYTATGIPREQVQKIGKENKAHDKFTRIVPEYETQLELEDVFHGGYVHNNRHFIERVIKSSMYGLIYAFDFASSYPFTMLAYKFPMERFFVYGTAKPETILEASDKYAFIFKLIMIKPRLKDDFIAMPALQKSKLKKGVNIVEDNGRILCAAYTEIWLNETDLSVIMQQYDYDKAICVNVKASKKDYLPRWFTDYIFETFKEKTQLKGGDAVLYSIAKAKLNSLYGMTVQKPIKETIEEDYITGKYDIPDDSDPKEIYEKYKKKYTSVLPYQIGVWVTSYAFRNLFRLGDCFETWLYSDTDSCYGLNPDMDKIKAYNDECIRIIKERGYGPVNYNGRDYHLGIAELDGIYSEFISVGAKRYACRDNETGKLKITVAGVPKKKGVKCLNDDLRNFHAGFIFDGNITGKMQHTYFQSEDITIDKNGNERADSIDLSKCDYKLDSVRSVDWERIFEEEIEVQVYEEDES